MRSEWTEAKLTDLYDISSGLSKPAEEFGSGYPFLAFKDVFNNFFVPDELDQLVNSNKSEQEKCSIKRGDVFLTRTSETMNELGMSSVALKDYVGATFNGFTKRLRPKTENVLAPEFVGYYLRSRKFRNEMLAFSSMSTRASLNNEMIGTLSISFPCIEEQAEIANILKSLDDKIELNRKQNRTLEAIAQALYKHWFVDFEFPDENGNPYKSSGGALQPSELGEIPVGWSIKPLDQVADYLNGLALQKFPPESDTDYLPVIKIRELKQGISANSDRASTKLDPKYIVEDGDVLFSWSGSLEVDIWCGGRGALNQHLFKVTSATHPKWLYLLWTKHHLRAFQAVAADKATTMGHIQRSHLSEALTAIPRDEQLAEMSTTFEPIIEKIILNRIEARTLAKTRDTLLPKLMSGELRVA